MVNWWANTLFLVHPELRIHMGGDMSMDYGIIHIKLSKQKINENSSMEVELVEVSEYIPYHLWLMMFI